ncbi:MAG: flagellar biosynthesis protein FlhF [Clostridium sp.]|nr:flagellar biosynthesis protein FlhF [Clostridium sp.]MCM1397989.1 flagellar biosynthesis protein FlhF [Clostridium sp.]MCM1459375.1 flagellar biosynthesis protein FlhF [Bacteroides sp.]
MIIKKFEAQTEKEATLMAREELGPEAIVMNIKTIKPKGIFKLFKKNRVELTAAIDDNVNEKKSIASERTVTSDTKSEYYRFGNVFANSDNEFTDEAKNAIEEKINNIAKLLEQQVSVAKAEEASDTDKKDEKDAEASDDAAEEKEQGNKVVDLIRSQLIENELSEKHVDAIIDELELSNDEQPLDNVLSKIYQKIVLKLGEIANLKAEEKKPKIVFFVGSTGVGKTTTMAKLASKYKIEEKLDIAMFSVDTYRIAAIDQIKTYANIINTPMEVVYTPEEMKNLVEKYKECDLIFVDTAGRSHKNNEQKNDLASIINAVKDYEKEIYLVVSVTTKYSDLLSIAKTYEEMFDYKLIFTKLDETRGLGNILNLKLDMNKQLSYVTWGQNVPDDMGSLNPQVIAKKLLGGTE